MIDYKKKVDPLKMKKGDVIDLNAAAKAVVIR